MHAELSISSDVDQFAALVQPHLARMAILAERIGGAADRDDIVQEALLRAWVKRHQYDPGRGALSNWLLAITADRARRLARRRRSPAHVEAGSESRTDDRLDIERALAELPRRQRLSVDCYYFVGLSVAETAAVMNCSEGTVKSTLSDARARLKAILGEKRQ